MEFILQKLIYLLVGDINLKNVLAYMQRAAIYV